MPSSTTLAPWRPATPTSTGAFTAIEVRPLSRWRRWLIRQGLLGNYGDGGGGGEGGGGANGGGG